MRLRVISDSSHPNNTRVIDEDTGESLEGVVSVQFSHIATEPSLLIIKTVEFTTDVTTEGNLKSVNPST